MKFGWALKPYSDTGGYLQVDLYENNNRKKYLVRRLVAQEFIDNTEDKTDIDHIDRNKQNNCINNLRWALSSENSMNRNKQKPCSSCFKGVSWHKQQQKWRAVINTDTGHKHIGSFASEVDAAQAYTETATELFGAFANLNIL